MKSRDFSEENFCPKVNNHRDRNYKVHIACLDFQKFSQLSLWQNLKENNEPLHQCRGIFSWMKVMKEWFRGQKWKHEKC